MAFGMFGARHLCALAKVLTVARNRGDPAYFPNKAFETPTRGKAGRIVWALHLEATHVYAQFAISDGEKVLVLLAPLDLARVTHVAVTLWPVYNSA